jgi:hypothetical protein
LCYSALHKIRPIGKRDPTIASGVAGLADRDAAELESTRLSAMSSFCLHHQNEVPVKYLTRIAASGALLVVALGIVTFAQIKFAPQSADNNPVARIVLNVESQLNG